MKIAISSDFFTALSKLPKAQMNKTIKLVEKFKNDPTSSGINYEKLHFSADGRMHSIRVDDAYRCIIMKPEQDDVYIMLWVDHHDEAYDWAKRHKCMINPENGSLQIIETNYITEETPVITLKNTKTIYSDMRDKDLVRLGVPEGLISQVKQIQYEYELDSLRSNMPEEAYEGLFYLLAGDSLENVFGYLSLDNHEKHVDIEDFVAALEHENSKRRFYVVDDKEIDLIGMLNAPLEKWRVFLHPTQRKIINRDWNGPVRILGGAGTGKTVVAMHRAKWLAEKSLASDTKILFTTFTKNLAVDIYENLKKICSESILSKIEVKNLDQWVYEFLYKNGYQERIVYADETARLWEQALLIKPSTLDMPDKFFHEEWERVVQPQSITNLQEYIAASRIGRGTRLNRVQRKEVWEVFEEYRMLLVKHNFKEPSDAMRDARILIENGKLGDYYSVVVDETQDFSSQALMLLRQMIPESKNDLFFVGDAHQRIYGHRTNLSQCGIKIVGRSRKLKLNYRTTDEIRRWASALFNNATIDDMDAGQDTQIDYKSLYHGPAPVIKQCNNFEDECVYINEYVKSLLSDETNSQICLVVRTNRLVKEYKERLEGLGLPVIILSQNTRDDLSKKGLRIATMHRVKGLDFDHVIIGSVNDGTVPLKYAIESSEEAIGAEKLLQEKSLIFVAATRAKKTLLVTSYGKISEFL